MKEIVYNSYCFHSSTCNFNSHFTCKTVQVAQAVGDLPCARHGQFHWAPAHPSLGKAEPPRQDGSASGKCV